MITRRVLRWPGGERDLATALLIGSDHHRCDVALDDPIVAPVHCVLRPAAESVDVVNCAGDGVRIQTWAVHGRSSLAVGEVLRVGRTPFTLEALPDAGAQRACEDRAAAARALASRLGGEVLDVAVLACHAAAGAVLARGPDGAWAAVAGARALAALGVEPPAAPRLLTAREVRAMTGNGAGDLAGPALVAALGGDRLLVLARRRYAPPFDEGDRTVTSMLLEM